MVYHNNITRLCNNPPMMCLEEHVIGYSVRPIILLEVYDSAIGGQYHLHLGLANSSAKGLKGTYQKLQTQEWTGAAFHMLYSKPLGGAPRLDQSDQQSYPNHEERRPDMKGTDYCMCL
ncbi:hypothetical protein VNO77_17822 [Canavalia gladiata]|uniref:Uncharacterized protein n=1 Tax=Canavalia gladiata TaxID=3824 RepID=A0AAN9LJP8_CANGL